MRVDSVPKEFRKDLEAEMVGISEQVVNHFRTNLMQSPDKFVGHELRRIVEDSMKSYLQHLTPLFELTPWEFEAIKSKLKEIDIESRYNYYEYHVSEEQLIKWFGQDYEINQVYSYFFLRNLGDVLAERLFEKLFTEKFSDLLYKSFLGQLSETQRFFVDVLAERIVDKIDRRNW